jgi:hypothetical protein
MPPVLVELLLVLVVILVEDTRVDRDEELVVPGVSVALVLVELLLVPVVTLLQGVRVYEDDEVLLVPDVTSVDETRVDLDEVVLPDVSVFLLLLDLLLAPVVTLLEGVRVDDDELLVPEFIPVEETR